MYTWWIPDGFVPSTPAGSAIIGHEALAVLNDTDAPARLTVALYFTDREPELGHAFTIGARRSARVILGAGYQLAGALHVHVEPGLPYSLRVCADAALHLQFTRVDTRTERLALMTALLAPQPEDSEEAYATV